VPAAGNSSPDRFSGNHDELDLGRLTQEQRQAVFAEFGPEPEMQLYEGGIRRRLAPMLKGTPQEAGACVQPDIDASGHSSDSIWRRDRNGRRSFATRARVRADGNAVVG
jgi:hypothetical protein